MREDVELTAFTRGEVSPRLKGRTDYKGYYDALAELLNMVVLPQGGVTRRPGTLYAADAKDQTAPCHLVGFQFKTTQAYMLEFGALYIRVFRDRAPVTAVHAVTGTADNGAGLIRLTMASTAGLYDGNTMTVSGVGGTTEADGTWIIDVINSTHVDLVGSAFVNAWTSGGTTSTIVEIPTAYTSGELRPLAFTQSADTLYILSPTHKPATLTRSSHTVWTLADITFLDGPYLPVNTTATTLALGATTGSVTVTASAITGINNDTGFQTTDVGRLIRFKSATWNWLLITAWTSTTVVTATIQADVANGASGTVSAGTATDQWRLGKWSDTTGWPWEPTFWQQRFSANGTNNQPNALEQSQTGDFVNFAPTKSDGTVVDVNALSWIISDDQVNAVRWVSPAGSAQAMQLGIGTDGSEHILQAATTAQALTPTSVQAYRETTLGSKAYANALRVGKSVLFVNAAGRKVHQWQFDWQVNGYQGPDLTVDSEHITADILSDMVYQKNPNGVIFAIDEAGGLKGFTYLPEQGIRSAWHRHQLGGDYYGGPPIVEAIAVIPSTDGTYDELWLAVKRTIDGATVRYIEVMDRYFDGAQQAQEQAVVMDSALSSDVVHPTGTIAPSTLDVTDDAGDAVLVTFTASAGTPFASGDVGSVLRMAGAVATITAFTSSTVVAGYWYTAPPNLAPATTGDWSLTPQHASFSGLDHLEGQEVQILGDGADCGTATVTAGVAALSVGTASFATIGLPTVYRLVTMPWEPQRAAAASSQGKIKTIDHMYIRYQDSLGFDFGRRVTDPLTGEIEDKSEPIETRSAGDFLGRAPPLRSLVARVAPQGSHDQEGQMLIEGSGPFPTTILAIVASGDVGEMPGPG